MDIVSKMSRIAASDDRLRAGEDGWIVASIPEVLGANSQGRTRDEARASVVDALRGILELRFGGHPDIATTADSEPLELVIGA